MVIRVFYHGVDFDGYCSAAIIGMMYNWKGVLFYPINHGDDFPWDIIEPEDIVYMVDFTLSPFPNMIKLNNICTFVWIDHHRTAIKEYIEWINDNPDYEIRGIVQEGKAACELVWEYFSELEMPFAVRMYGRYDVWDHHNVNKCLEFQYGSRQIKNPHPSNIELWTRLLIEDDKSFIDKIINNGRVILEYEQTRNIKLCSIFCFETELDGYKAIALNKGIANSQAFESVWDPDKYDFMIAFIRSKGKWTVSLYTDKDINVGEICKRYGGGGHPGAAGFTCKELPFEY